MRTRAVNHHEIAYFNYLSGMSSLRIIGRYWHFLRHLRPHQIYGRVLFDRVMPRHADRARPPIPDCECEDAIQGAQKCAPLQICFWPISLGEAEDDLRIRNDCRN